MRLLSNIALTRAQLDDGTTKHEGVRAALNAHYWGASSKDANSMLVGSWGKKTRVRPPRDVDVLFQLPAGVYRRFETRTGNRQSDLLQEVKGVLLRTYPDTEMKGDGQVVVVPFGSYKVEVVPAFALEEGGFWICDTHDGGKYKKVDPVAENTGFDAFDRGVNGNLRRLTRMLKQWQRHCNVPLGSCCLEMLALEFLRTWQYRLHDSYYYDWMARDFFQFLLRYGNGTVTLLNGPAKIPLGWSWYSRAKSAADNSQKASSLDSDGYHYMAADEWKKIFGDEFESL